VNSNFVTLTPQRLLRAYQRARLDLLAQRVPAGHWVGELSTSALSTATAVSALSLVERHARTDASAGRCSDAARESQFSELISGGISWLAEHQNDDGGWGDTDKSHSNIATTMLAVAAFQLTGVPDRHRRLLDRARTYIDDQGGAAGLRRRYGKDKTFAVPILTNCALAGTAFWRDVAPLPFELACFPQSLYRFLQLPVVSYAIPALVAIGQARFFHRRPWNPLVRAWRRAAVEPSLRVLQRIQPASGGFLEATPLTSFVVMSLASIGRVEHEVTRRGVQFIVDSVRPDGSWPIDTNLATWNTTLALNALAGAGEDAGELAPLDWLLGCQCVERHPYTGADPGGWGWSDLSGAVPDADDTPGALLALAAVIDSPSCSKADRERIERAASAGISWLLGLQNRDGGWPTFCRGWGHLPFDRSGSDLTAHVLRALCIWQKKLAAAASGGSLHDRIDRAVGRGFQYLARGQAAAGWWIPLWFGNQDHPREENPVYGTAKVLLAYRDTGQYDTEAAQRGLHWLAGWLAEQTRDVSPDDAARPVAVEEVALAVEALLAAGAASIDREVVAQGLAWLVDAVESGRHFDSAPIGFYFARLWYYERLYPLVFTVSALGRAARCWEAPAATDAGTSHPNCESHLLP